MAPFKNLLVRNFCGPQRTLRLDYTRLKEQVESARRTPRQAGSPAFVELITPRPGSFPEGLVELETV